LHSGGLATPDDRRKLCRFRRRPGIERFTTEALHRKRLERCCDVANDDRVLRGDSALAVRVFL